MGREGTGLKSEANEIHKKDLSSFARYGCENEQEQSNSRVGLVVDTNGTGIRGDGLEFGLVPVTADLTPRPPSLGGKGEVDGGREGGD